MTTEPDLRLPKLADVHRADLVHRAWLTFVSLWWALPIAVPVLLALASVFNLVTAPQNSVLLIISLFLLVWGIVYGLLNRSDRLYARTLYSDTYKADLRAWALSKYGLTLTDNQVRDLTGRGATVERGVYRSTEAFFTISHPDDGEDQITVVLEKHPRRPAELINLWTGQELARVDESS